MDKFAKEAYGLLYPNTSTPEVINQNSKISSIADRYPGSEFRKYLLGLVRSKEKFAYLFEISPKGEILSLVNLKTGAIVQ